MVVNGSNQATLAADPTNKALIPNITTTTTTTTTACHSKFVKRVLGGDVFWYKLYMNSKSFLTLCTSFVVDT